MNSVDASENTTNKMSKMSTKLPDPRGKTRTVPMQVNKPPSSYSSSNSHVLIMADSLSGPQSLWHRITMQSIGDLGRPDLPWLAVDGESQTIRPLG